MHFLTLFDLFQISMFFLDKYFSCSCWNLDKISLWSAHIFAQHKDKTCWSRNKSQMCKKSRQATKQQRSHDVDQKFRKKNFLILHFLSAKFHALLDLAGKKTHQKGLVLIYIMQNSASGFSLQQGYDILNHKEAFWIHEMMIKYFSKSIDKNVKRKWLP